METFVDRISYENISQFFSLILTLNTDRGNIMETLIMRYVLHLLCAHLDQTLISANIPYIKTLDIYVNDFTQNILDQLYDFF